MSNIKPLSKIAAVICFTFIVYSCNGQPMRTEQPQKIKWMGFEEAVALGEKQPKKLFIDVYTNWCGWCTKKWMPPLLWMMVLQTM